MREAARNSPSHSQNVIWNLNIVTRISLLQSMLLFPKDFLDNADHTKFMAKSKKIIELSI